MRKVDTALKFEWSTEPAPEKQTDSYNRYVDVCILLEKVNLVMCPAAFSVVVSGGTTYQSRHRTLHLHRNLNTRPHVVSIVRSMHSFSQ